MAGLRSNVAWLLAAKQTGKGVVPTPAAANAFKMPFTGGNIGPSRETDRITETDATRDAGDAYVVSSGVEGSPEFLARDNSLPFWLKAAFGNLVTTGTGPNYTHTITPGDVLPYVAIWRNISNTLYEEYRDCKVGAVTLSADAGGLLSVGTTILGRGSTRLLGSPDDAAPVEVEKGAPYNFNNATVTLGGGATSLVSSFELTVENNISAQQTDDAVPYDVVEGGREISLGFDYIFESLDEYNKFHYGGAAGTQQSTNIYSTSALFSFDLGANNSIAFNLPEITYEEFPIEPDPGGDPIVVSVRAVTKRGAGSAVTATIRNQNAGAAY